MSKHQADFAYAVTTYLSVYLPGTKGVSKNTVLSYRDTFSLLLTFCREKRGIAPERLSFDHLDRASIEDFLCWLETERHSSVSTRNQRLAAIRAFFRYIQVYYPEQMFLCRQIIGIPAKASRQRTMNYLSLDGVKLLLSMPNTHSRQGRRDAVLMSLLYDAGARVQEVVDVCFADVRTEFPATLRLSGKGGKVRIVPLSTGTAELLQLYICEQSTRNPAHGNMPLFQNRSGQKMTRAGVAYILKKYADMARSIKPGLIPEVISPHCLRHSKAMHLLQNGVNLVYIRDLLGHTDLRTTEIYARAESEAKRKALEKASPISCTTSYPSWVEDDDLLTWLQSFGAER